MDAAVIGSGPNGLASAITLARAGLSVVLYEAKETIGGGMRSCELTLPGFMHDVCSAIHPFVLSSPFFKEIPLCLEWVYPPLALAHPLDGKAVILEKSIDATAERLGRDHQAYLKIFQSLTSEALIQEILAPFHLSWPLAHFGFYALRSAEKFCKKYFRDQEARALFAGLAAHSLLPLNKATTSAFALALGIEAHLVGWPFPKGGAQKIANALGAYFTSLGGKIMTNCKIKSLDELSHAKIVLCDVAPKQLLKLAPTLPKSYKNKLARYRYGPGVFKMDWALSEPIPWKEKEVKRAGTVHVGGSLEEISCYEKGVWEKFRPDNPFVILAQHTLFDVSRAPRGRHTAWGYCHVPSDSSVDMTEVIESQIERFAPGFRDCILGRSQKNALDMQQYNANYVGGDISGGVSFFKMSYKTPIKGLYLCSSSTPPGGGVHGMCGYLAARKALEECGKIF